MALDDFEKELFDDLDGYQSHLNLDQEWQELEERLPKKKKRRFVIWWLSGLTTGLVIASILFYNNKNTNAISEVNIAIAASHSKEIPNSQITTIAQEEVSKQISNTEKIQPTLEVATSRPSTKNKSFSNIVVPNASVSVNYVSTIGDSKNQNHIITPTDFNQKETAAFFPTVLPKPLEQINISNLFAPIFYLKISKSELEIPVDYYFKYIESNSPKEKENKVKGNWSAALGFTYGINQFKRKSSNVDLQNQIDFLSEYEDQVDYMGIQLKIYKNLNKHFSLFSGIHASQHTNLFQLGESFEVERDDPSALLEEHFFLTGLVQQIYGEGSTQYDVTIQSKLWQKYQSIGIPLGISIHTALDKKWSFQNDLAVMIHPFQNTQGRKIIKTATDYFIFDNNTYTSKTFTSLADQFILNWKMTNHFTLQLSADMGMDLSSRLKTGAQYDFRFSYIGVGLGGKFLF